MRLNDGAATKRCVLVAALDWGQVLHSAEGTVEGLILEAPRGREGLATILFSICLRWTNDGGNRPRDQAFASAIAGGAIVALLPMLAKWRLRTRLELTCGPSRLDGRSTKDTNNAWSNTPRLFVSHFLEPISTRSLSGADNSMASSPTTCRGIPFVAAYSHCEPPRHIVYLAQASLAAWHRSHRRLPAGAFAFELSSHPWSGSVWGAGDISQ